MNLFQLGQFGLSSGKESRYKIDCDALTDDDIGFFAERIRQKWPDFSHVYGIPRGGVRLAKALEQYAKPEGDYVLIVDDVMTTGTSFIRAWRDLAEDAGSSKRLSFRGAVMFDRSNGKNPSWVWSVCKVDID